MESQLSKKLPIGWIMLGVLLVGLLVLFVIFRYRKNKSQESQEPKPDEPNEPELMNPAKFYDLVTDRLPDLSDTARQIITAHAMHESGVFSSRVFLEDNNAFGMKQPEKRGTFSISQDDKGFAIFDSIPNSIDDLKLWFDFHNETMEFDRPASYAAKIREHGYYTDSYANYAQSMKIHFETVKKLVK